MMKITLFTLTFLIGYNTIAQLSPDKTSIKTHDIKGYGEHEEFASEAIMKLETVINSQEFEIWFLKLKMTQRRGNTKSQILNKILSGKELRGDGGQDKIIDLRLRVMTLEEDGKGWIENCKIGSKEGTIGKEGDASGYTVTCPDRIKIWAKHKSYACLAGHIMHEYMHNLGFKHRIFKSKTVVYRTGYLVRDIIQGNDSICPTE